MSSVMSEPAISIDGDHAGGEGDIEVTADVDARQRHGDRAAHRTRHTVRREGERPGAVREGDELGRSVAEGGARVRDGDLGRRGRSRARLREREVARQALAGHDDRDVRAVDPQVGTARQNQHDGGAVEREGLG